MATETELKLVLDPAAADALLASGLIPGEPLAKQQRARYFDTPDHALAAAGVSLRIRVSGDKRIQTIKLAGARGAGLFERGEWEMPVADDTPVLDDRTPVPALLGKAAEAVAPLFEVGVERLVWRIDDADAAIELVLDRGAAIAGDRRSPVCEVELELERGAPNALFALAGRLAEAVPVRLGVLTKAERGYGLLAAAAKAFKAERVALDETASAADAFRAVAGLCIRQYRLNETILLERREPEALHQARVSLRRLRSAFSIFKPLFAGDEAGRLQAELRWLTGVLGEARDLDVLAERAPPGALRDRLHAVRDQAYDEVEAALHAPRVRGLMLELTAWLAAGEWLAAEQLRDRREMPARRFASETLDRLRARVKKRGTALAKLDDGARHEVRKAAKRLRYGAEFFGALFPGRKRTRRYGSFLASLEALQEQLGALNDLATAPMVLDRLGLLDEPGAKALLGHRKKRKMLAAAEDAYAGLVDRKRFWDR